VTGQRKADLLEAGARSARQRVDALDLLMMLMDSDYVPAGTSTAQVQWWCYLSFVASGLGATTQRVRSMFTGELDALSSRLDDQWPGLRGEEPANAEQLAGMSAGDLLACLLEMDGEPREPEEFVPWAVTRRHVLGLIEDRLGVCCEAWEGLEANADRRSRTVLSVNARSKQGSDARTGFD
jgi:hypothetical protein